MNKITFLYVEQNSHVEYQEIEFDKNIELVDLRNHKPCMNVFFERDEEEKILKAEEMLIPLCIWKLEDMNGNVVEYNDDLLEDGQDIKYLATGVQAFSVVNDNELYFRRMPGESEAIGKGKITYNKARRIAELHIY